jgi:DNA polymerase-1
VRLLLVDGTNILLRCAWGGDISPAESVHTACAMIDRACKELTASHLVVALDYPDEPTWRHKLYPQYKANRKVDTSPWIIAGGAEFTQRGWHIEFAPGFEADDVIATIALRTKDRAPVTVFSNDSDLLPLTAAGIDVVRPLNGGSTQRFDAAGVMEKYQIPAAHLLYDFKAMTGEIGENIPGVPGIGMKRAADLLKKYGDLDSIIQVGKGGIEKYSKIVAEHEAAARMSLQLVSLHPDAPVPPIVPSTCALSRAKAAA